MCFPQKSKGSRSKPSTQGQLEEKDERIRHLEAVNITLKQTNDDLNEEVAELRRQLEEQAEKVILADYTLPVLDIFDVVLFLDYRSGA